MPRKSNERSSERPVTSRRITQPHKAPASPRGTLNQNTHGQLMATSAPPRTGPMTSPMAATMVLVPMASPSCSLGNASVTMAAELANRNAPLMP